MGQAIDRMLAAHTATEQEVEDAVAVAGGQQADTLLDVLSPVLNFEKSDIEFWVQILQLIVLVMILRRLS